MKKITEQIVQKLLLLSDKERKDVIACLIYKALEDLDEAEAERRYEKVIKTLATNL
jgi:hypothetical protein